MTTVAPPGTWALPSPGGGDPALARTLGRMAGDLYMVADGARHPRLAEGLAARGLAARPLWLEYDESGVQENGPWLCRLETPFAVEDALNVLGPGPQAVFWLWKAGEQALFRHLRHLNLVEIPLEEPPEEGPAHETVLFRHQDPEVLAPILPLLDADQKARLFGVAEGVVFNSLDFGGLAAVSAPSPFRPPDPTRRLLRFSPEQMAGIQAAREARSRRRIEAYVNDACGRKVEATALEQALQEGCAVGLRRERSLGLWAWLWVSTNGQTARDPEFGRMLSSRDFRDADDAMLRIAEETRRVLRGGSPW
jgi:hypothetical protein